MNWSNDVTLEFLRYYEQESVIWNQKHPLNKSRSAVMDAWGRITDLMSIQCSVGELKKKKESLMATFRPLLNKVKASIKAGHTGEDLYKPSWFAYDTMAKFLGGVYQPKYTTNSEEIEYIDDEDNDSESTLLEEIEMRPKTPENIFICPPTTVTKKRKRSDLDFIRMDVGTPPLIKNMKIEKDECSLYMDLLEKKLRAFDEHSRDILMHEIDNLVFRAKVQKVIPSPCYTNQPIQYNTSAINSCNKSSPGQSQCSPGHTNSNSSPPEHTYDTKPSPEIIYISQSSPPNKSASYY